MGTLLESREALKARGLEVSLTSDEIDALVHNRVDSLARLAFAACQPGESPTDEQIVALFAGRAVPNQGTFASMRRLIFEAQTLLSADLQNKVHKAGRERQDQISSCRKRQQNQRSKSKVGRAQISGRGRVFSSKLRPSASYA